MKEKKGSLILLPAILGVAIFSSLSVGTTFAIFTSSNQTEINISSGKIVMTPSLREYETTIEQVTYTPKFKTYSAFHDENGDLVDEGNNRYSHRLQNFRVDENGNYFYDFSEHGYATYNPNPGVISLVNMIPGDKIKFQYDIENDSNIAIKYRFVYKVVDPNNLGEDAYVLAKGLHVDFTVGSTSQIDAGTAVQTSFDGIKEYGSSWQVLAPDVNPDSLDIEISLPMNAGNTYQNKSAVILLTFESIQGNAQTTDTEPVYVVGN